MKTSISFVVVLSIIFVSCKDVISTNEMINSLVEKRLSQLDHPGTVQGLKITSDSTLFLDIEIDTVKFHQVQCVRLLSETLVFEISKKVKSVKSITVNLEVESISQSRKILIPKYGYKLLADTTSRNIFYQKTIVYLLQNLSQEDLDQLEYGFEILQEGRYVTADFADFYDLLREFSLGSEVVKSAFEVLVNFQLFKDNRVQPWKLKGLYDCCEVVYPRLLSTALGK